MVVPLRPSAPLSLALSTITDDIPPFLSTTFECSIRSRPRALNRFQNVVILGEKKLNLKSRQFNSLEV